jgi:hypothetical protein
LILNDWSGVPETCDGAELSVDSFRVLGQHMSSIRVSDRSRGQSRTASLIPLQLSSASCRRALTSHITG